MNNQEIFLKLAKIHNTPKKVQKFLHSFTYNSKSTMYSALTAIQKNECHCMEGAFVAAAILEHHNYPPLVISLESQDHLDHVLFAFQKNKLWGAIGQSRDEGLFGRPPLFRSIRDLVWSYYPPYIDETSKITAYQLAHLNDTKSNWRTSLRNVWKAENYLLELKHVPLKSSKNVYLKYLNSYKAGNRLKPQDFWW